ncbi:hypothetical protein PG996_007448 [Apiospora saccharicola]|uniref:Heterokaryon incompatibility domain-containing protein n=1 Tax=Apiospora saccharicola TaxID=335842 RepID=A0ABR1VAW8_9PEZI
MTHFQEAMKENSPTITRNAMREVESFADQFDRQNVERVRAFFNTKETNSTSRVSSAAVSRLNSKQKQGAEKGKAESRNNWLTNILNPSVDVPEGDATTHIKLGPCTPKSPYQPLAHDPSEIRVLELVEPVSPTSKIQCRLRTVTLQPDLSFTALSYMWGDPASNEEIILNEQPFRVTKSLANALRWVKHHWQQYFPGRAGSEFLIWADAICINQEDTVEKNFQVPLMRDIYSTAELVISSIALNNGAIKFALNTYRNIHVALDSDDSSTPMSFLELVDGDWMERVPHLIPKDDRDNHEENTEAAGMVLLLRALMKTVDYHETHRIFHPSFQKPFKGVKEEADWFYQNLAGKPSENWGNFYAEHLADAEPRLPAESNLLKTRFFETEDGYLGLGPLSLRSDDELCLFHNCPLPVILRKEKDHYTYVGPCWVVGLDSQEEVHRLELQGRIESRQFKML